MPNRPWNRARSDTGRPRGLRGKDIGLYYRNQAMKGGKQKQQKELVITLSIPTTVVTAMQTNIKSIMKIAKDSNVHLAPLKELNLTDIKDTDANINIPYVDHTFKTPELLPIKKECEDFDETKIKKNDEAMIVSDTDLETFKTQEFIPIKKECEEFDKAGTSKNEVYVKPHGPMVTDSIDIKSDERLLSLRGAGDYKYGYEDIITGTFDEKLEESISKGISINMKNADINNLSVALCVDYKEMVKRDKYRRMKKFRDILPTFQRSKELLDIINNNQVVVTSGETGCGKSTQVPQIILDDAIMNNRGANVRILVTQPRRIAASSLAMRVAEERAEKMGSSVGYAVRLEKVEARPRGSIMFCTTGILIADLEVNQGLTTYSHVILDEVHERDCHIDLSMCMLKQVLKKRKDLKLILMSATLDAEKLTAYFDNCPMFHIEGLAYPVKEVYLEEVLQMTQYVLPFEEPRGRNNMKPWYKHTKKGKMGAASEMEKDIKYKAEIAPWLESIKRNLDRDVYLTLQNARIEDLNINLICCLLTHICRGEPGAILVFLPGIGEITKLLRAMTESNAFPNSRYEIYPLHSKLPSLEQHKIFERPPGHIRKIIIATNIAETSITIDDIVYVVDCGKIKYSGLNVEENVSTLKTEWVSKANLRQRRGRAGRCQPGVCYHLVTSFRAEKLEERLLPEIQRSNLLEPLLSVKRLRLGKAAEALKKMASPPADSTVEWAVKHLQQCGALDDSEVLTPLGWHLARLPVHPAAGKLLLLGALFGCLDRAASVAAVWGFKDPFMMVIGKENEVDQAKRYLSLGEPSDHIAMSEAIIQWERCASSQKRNFAYEHFLSNHNLELLSDMKKQFGDNLRQMGFLTSGDVRSRWENRNAHNLSLFKAIVAASLYPNIATVRWTNSRNPRKIPRIKVRTPEDGHVDLHPSSVMCTKAGRQRGAGGAIGPACVCPGANWLVYWLKQRSTDLFVIDVTLVYTLPLLFFGEIKVAQAQDEKNYDNCIISISSIKVSCNKATMQLLFKLRSLLDQVLASKITVSSNHGTQHNHFEEQVLNAVIEVISAEDSCERGDYESDSDHSEHESNRSWYY